MTGGTTRRGVKSRYETLGSAARLPDNPAPHLTDWLLEIGPTNSEGGSIGWRDIEAWQSIVGIELEPWEARLIKRLSAEYASMRFRGEKADCPAPYMLVTPEAQDRVAAQFRAMVAAMKGR
jgi:hypothetical protein